MKGNVQGTDIASERKVHGIDMSSVSMRNVQGTDITYRRNVQGTDITYRWNVQGQTLQGIS